MRSRKPAANIALNDMAREVISVKFLFLILVKCLADRMRVLMRHIVKPSNVS